MMPWICLRLNIGDDLHFNEDTAPEPEQSRDAGGHGTDNGEVPANVIDAGGAGRAGIFSALRSCAVCTASALSNSCIANAIRHEPAALVRAAIITGSIASFVVSTEFLYEAATRHGGSGAAQTMGITICSLLMPVSVATAFSSTRIAETCFPNAHSREVHPLPV